jgi:hypothetical protein
MATLGRGMGYFQIQHTFTEGTATLDVVRILPTARPFVIAPLLGKSLYHKPGQLPTVSTHQDRSLKAIEKYLRYRNYHIRWNGTIVDTYPMWVSNGTFFEMTNNDDTLPSLIAAPIVYESVGTNDPNATDFRKGKGKRWFMGQKPHLPHSQYMHIDLQQNVQGLLSTKLADTYLYLIGGAGALVINGKAMNDDFWESPSGGKFITRDVLGSQGYSAGTIIASNDAAIEHRIHYLILCRSIIPWRELAPYLSNDFIRDIGNAAGARPPYDGKIQNAIVYDGGGSRQLWIRRPHNMPSLIPGYGTRPVPQFICLYGVRNPEDVF